MGGGGNAEEMYDHFKPSYEGPTSPQSPREVGPGHSGKHVLSRWKKRKIASPPKETSRKKIKHGQADQEEGRFSRKVLRTRGRNLLKTRIQSADESPK